MAHRPPPITINSSDQDVTADIPNTPRATVRTTTTTSPDTLYPSSTPPGVSTDQLLSPASLHAQSYEHTSASSRSSLDSDTPMSGGLLMDGIAHGSGHNPFSNSRAPSRAPSRAEATSGTPLTPLTPPQSAFTSQTILDKYSFTPEEGLIVFPQDVENDDALHAPDEKEPRECDIFTKRGAINVGGLGLIVVGILVLFIGYPVLTFAQHYVSEMKIEKQKEDNEKCPFGAALCLDVDDIPLLKNVRTSLIDPDTPKTAYTKKTSDGKEWKLVFSDEFNAENRTFYPGEDPYWEAVDIHYAATVDLEWYDPDAATTKDGVLELEFARLRNHDLDFRSAMLQSWNKLCFKGGIVEASISLPGKGDTSGFWGSFWTMGNLGRPGYLATTEGMWPYSYHDGCDAGITANQSSPDGISFLPGMKLPGCTCKGEDHPTPGKSRGAPEIDALEASVGKISNGKVVGTASQSAQVAPFDIWYQPDYDHIAIYNPRFTSMSSYRGGHFQEAISGLSTLNNDWYDGKAYQVYGFEYEPGTDGYVEFFVGDMKTWRMNGAATGENGNIGARPISVEPMALILNLGMSPSFAPIDFAAIDKLLPSKMRIDWVRIYQGPDQQMVTCDPPGYETTEYIEDHPEPYNNANLTTWDKTKYKWPRNTLVDDCN